MSAKNASGRRGFRELVQACQLNDAARVASLLAAGVDADQPVDDTGDTLLVQAVRGERVELARALLAGGASIQRANAAGETAESLALASASLRIRRLFVPVERLEPPEARLFELVDRAARAADAAVAVQLVAAAGRADLAVARGGLTPLLAYAAGGGRDPAVYAGLVEAGADPAIADARGDTALHHLARRGGDPEAARALLGGALATANARGETALHLAARAGAVPLVRLLVETGADPSRRDGVGRTPAEGASEHVVAALGEHAVSPLEQALRARWTLDALAIHGDALQQAGDPRGELIALDLAPRPTSGPWRERRRALVAAWLGDDLAPRAGDVTRYGFVPQLDDRGGFTQARRPASQRASELLDSPAGPFVRAFAVSGPPARVTASLYRLARRPRPWLTELVILCTPGEPLPAELVAQLVAATPNLASVHALGGRIFASLPHPRVVRLVTTVALDDPRARPITSVTPPGLDFHDLLVLLEAIATTSDRAALAGEYAPLFPELPAHLAFLEGIAALDDDGLTALGRALRVHQVELVDGRIVGR